MRPQFFGLRHTSAPVSKLYETDYRFITYWTEWPALRPDSAATDYLLIAIHRLSTRTEMVGRSRRGGWC